MPVTIISVVPFLIREQKPSVLPAEFIIQPAPTGDVSILVVEDARTYIYLDSERGSLERRIPAEDLAKSIVDDFANANLAVTPEAKPGIFWVPGQFSKETAVTKFKDEIIKARATQSKWFGNLIQLADDDWSKYKQLKMISDLQKTAARTLNLRREWLVDNTPGSFIPCPACKSLVSTDAVVCFACKLILKAEEHKKMQFAG